MTLQEAKKRRDNLIDYARAQGAHVKTVTEFKGDKEAYVSVLVTFRIVNNTYTDEPKLPPPPPPPILNQMTKKEFSKFK